MVMENYVKVQQLRLFLHFEQVSNEFVEDHKVKRVEAIHVEELFDKLVFDVIQQLLVDLEVNN